MTVSNTTPEVDVLSTGPSAPRAFKDKNFDYQFSRFLGLATYSGAEIGECFATAHKIQDGNSASWIEEWTKIARRVEGLADKSLKGGHKISAREAFLRATTYYQAAFFLTLDTDPRKAELYKKHTGCFQAAGALFDPPFERIHIPYDGRYLVGYFLRTDSKPRPTVMIQMGADGSSEQIYFSGGGAAALRRGYNALIFEGPGQTGTYMEDPSLVYRYDWEVPVKAVVDYALSRPEVDPKRLALIAYSMGGYYGPRAVAFEKRITACIVSGLMPDMEAALNARVDSIFEHVNGNFTEQDLYLLHELMPKHGLKNGVDDLPKLQEILRKMNLDGLAEKITCPFMNIHAISEGPNSVRRAQEFFDKLPPNPKNEFVVTTADDGADMHCQKGNASFLHALEFDWLDEVMG